MRRAVLAKSAKSHIPIRLRGTNPNSRPNSIRWMDRPTRAVNFQLREVFPSLMGMPCAQTYNLPTYFCLDAGKITVSTERTPTTVHQRWNELRPRSDPLQNLWASAVLHSRGEMSSLPPPAAAQSGVSYSAYGAAGVARRRPGALRKIA